CSVPTTSARPRRRPRSARCSSTAKTNSECSPTGSARWSRRAVAADAARPGTQAATEAAVAFARFLRAEGLDVPVGATLTFVEALDLVGLDDRDAVYWAGRATLVLHPEHIELYDRVFRAFWLRAGFDARDDAPVEHL